MYKLHVGKLVGDVWQNSGYINVTPPDISEFIDFSKRRLVDLIDYMTSDALIVPDLGTALNWYADDNAILINENIDYALSNEPSYITDSAIIIMCNYNVYDDYTSYRVRMPFNYVYNDEVRTGYTGDAYSYNNNPKMLVVQASDPAIPDSKYLGSVKVESNGNVVLIGLVNIATLNIPEIDDEEAKEGEESKPKDYGGTTPYYYKDHANVGVPPTPVSGQDFNEFYHVYKCDALTMRNFNGFLWTDSVYSGFVKMVGDPLSAIVNCMVFPFNVETNAQREYIILGNWDSRVASDVVSRQYQSIDMGEVKFAYNTSSFLDSNPFSKVQIYLPYCGVYTLDPKDVIGHTIGVEYHVDVLSGECMAFVTTTRFGSDPAHLILQANGNCCRNVQISAETSNKLVNSISGALSGAFAGGVSGGIGGALAGGVSGAVGGVTGKDAISTGGSYSGQVGFMSYQTPYIFADVPEYLRPGNYDRLNGRPAYIRNKVKNYSGFLSVESIELDIPRATEEEKREIIRLLKQGVII